MTDLIISREELSALWVASRSGFRGVSPKSKYAVAHESACRLFPPDRNPHEIADRFYALMRCLDSSEQELNKGESAVYGSKQATISKGVIYKLWDYFGDRSRAIDPRNIVRACEII